MIEDTSEPYDDYQEPSLEHQQALDQIATAADWMVVILDYLRRTNSFNQMSDHEFGAVEEVVTALKINYKIGG